jgi:hypothetical protein
VSNVTDYLELAQHCTVLANRKTGAEKKRLMQLAKAWLKLADEAAEEEAKSASAFVKADPRAPVK